MAANLWPEVANMWGVVTELVCSGVVTVPELDLTTGTDLQKLTAIGKTDYSSTSMIAGQSCFVSVTYPSQKQKVDDIQEILGETPTDNGLGYENYPIS